MKLFASIVSSLILTSIYICAQGVDYQKIHSLVKATKEENIWRDKIDWKTDLWEARQLAGKLGKPIFIWEMDGHPMGCT